MAKVQITQTYTTPTAGLYVESGLGNVVIGGALFNLSSATFPFTVPGGTVIEAYTTQDFAIFGDDAGVNLPGNLQEAANDAAAAALTPPVPVGGLYRNGSDVMIRVA